MDKSHEDIIDQYITVNDMLKFGAIDRVEYDETGNGYSWNVYFRNARIQIKKSWRMHCIDKQYLKIDKLPVENNLYDIPLKYDGPSEIGYCDHRIANIFYNGRYDILGITYNIHGGSIMFLEEPGIKFDNCNCLQLGFDSYIDDFPGSREAFEYVDKYRPVTGVTDLDYGNFDPNGNFKIMDDMIANHYETLKEIGRIGETQLTHITLDISGKSDKFETMTQHFENGKLYKVSLNSSTSTKRVVYPEDELRETINTVGDISDDEKREFVIALLDLGLYAKSDIFAMLL